MNEMEIRIAMFLWLKERVAFHGNVFLRWELTNEFEYQNRRVTLVGPKGIWFPEGFTMPISISTTSKGPYDDGFSDNGFLDYRYRGLDPNHPDNLGLKRLFETRTPLVYFHSITPGKYSAVWPIHILRNMPSQLTIQAAIDPAYQVFGKLSAPEEILIDENESVIGVRQYITTETKRRLHQTAFRELVLDAYNRQCTLCRLQHPELLDAAHIIADSDERGLPVVTNGLSLCKIHHAAYDKNIIGISPDYKIKVRQDILEEIDGPMLKYGLQSLEGNDLVLPKKHKEWPDRDRLEERYIIFRSA